MKRVDLRDSEVDGHFLPREGEDRRIEELLGSLEFLGSSNNAAARKMGLVIVDWQGGGRVPKKEVFIGQRGQGQI